jgi:uncharacterized protein (DUF488 family)
VWAVSAHDAGVTTTTSQPPSATVLTIGYEGRTADQLVDELLAASVSVLIDVRLTPLSRKPGLSKRRLAASLAERGVGYVHLPALGNPKENRGPYRDGEPWGRSRFQECLETEAASAAFDELAALALAGRIALLCFERQPHTCHRQMVGEELVRRSPSLSLAHA